MRRSAVITAVLLIAAGAGWAAPDKAIEVPLKDFTFKVAADLASLFMFDEGEGKLAFYTNGAAEATVKVPEAGTYTIVVKASGPAALKEYPKFKVSVEGKQVGKETELTQEDPKEYTLTATLKEGANKLSIEFTNDAYKENEYDRNLYVHAVTLKKAK